MVDDRTLVARAVLILELAVLVAEAHIAVLDSTSAHLEWAGIGRILDIGRALKHFVHAAEAGDGLLERFGRVDEGLDGRGEKADIERKRCHIDRTHAARGNKAPACHHHEREQRPGHERARGLIGSHHAIHSLFRAEIAVVGAAELDALGLFVRERLHHAHAGERVLKL
ncbi:unknown [Collinsella sp. CAG:398]|nr:unknown [Collinsella sp. CAG:398]